MATNGGPDLWRKLGVAAGHTLLAVNAPDGLLDDLPAGVGVKDRAQGHAEVAVAFFVRGPELARRLDALARAVFPEGTLWVAWPKRSSGVVTDITDHLVRAEALPRGLVDNKVVAVDDIWSALRLVWRRQTRPPRP